MALFHALWKHQDRRSVDHIATIAIKEWMARNYGRPVERGYQWKNLFLPHGTRLRINHCYMSHFAQVEGDLLIAEGRVVTPRGWANEVCGCVRNAWRDIWVQRHYTECWMRASDWRTGEAANPRRPAVERRRHARRLAD
ncbi:hypothetical protein GTP58_17020 [Duganella sp. CY15W]|uniref:hypothetical protein n=1 Tax=Duganella sp. CY15W TaxID=2692172 RepID=UPI0013691C1F|nr:hypothetical protein [Duganella sp. CY15W]MYM30035.1 hypothetical protein [Duganella sp. CY15W]